MNPWWASLWHAWIPLTQLTIPLFVFPLSSDYQKKCIKIGIVQWKYNICIESIQREYSKSLVLYFLPKHLHFKKVKEKSAKAAMKHRN